MDWFLSVFTVFVNSNLGWSGGSWWAWLIHGINAVVWIIFAIMIEQYGLIALSVMTIILDTVSGVKSWRNRVKCY